MYSQDLRYQHDNANLIGYITYDETIAKPRPAVLIAHDWTGRNDFACQKAMAFAQLGYVGFAIDMFSNGTLGKNNDEKAQLIKPLVSDRQLMRDRITAALNCLREQKQVDDQRIAAIGFCFGGMCVLDLARTGADLKGVVSFHGLLNPANLANANITAKVLALHGYDDPMATPEQMLVFTNEFTAAGADWQLHAYGNTKHAFTNPLANDPSFGTVYDATAAKRSWQAMLNFFEEIFV